MLIKEKLLWDEPSTVPGTELGLMHLSTEVRNGGTEEFLLICFLRMEQRQEHELLG